MLSKIYEMVIKIMSLLFLFSGLNFDLLAFLRLGFYKYKCLFLSVNLRSNSKEGTFCFIYSKK